MTDYPFLVKGRVKKVRAPNYSNALDRVLYKHRNVFIQTKHARRMSLIEASEEAKKQSKLSKGKRIYVVTDKTGEADFATLIKVTDTPQCVFVNGKMDKLTQEEKDGGRVPDKNPVNKPTVEATRGSMSKTFEKHVKAIEGNKTLNKIIETGMKNANKKAAKKVAPVNSKSVAKASAPKKVVSGGKKVDISIKQMLLNMKKGFFYRDPQGVRQSENYMKGRANQDHVRTGMLEFKETAA